MKYINHKKQATPIAHGVPKESLNIHRVNQAKQKPLGDTQAL